MREQAAGVEGSASNSNVVVNGGASGTDEWGWQVVVTNGGAAAKRNGGASGGGEWGTNGSGEAHGGGSGLMSDSAR